MADTDKKPEFLTEKEYETLLLDQPENQNELVVSEDWEVQLATLAEKGTGRLRVPRSGDLNRKQVVSAFMNAFELIGGTPRLALWANDNPKDFYKLYARLLPSQASAALGESNELVVRHVLPRGALDQ
jgi:hypothetical protein